MVQLHSSAAMLHAPPGAAPPTSLTPTATSAASMTPTATTAPTTSLTPTGTTASMTPTATKVIKGFQVLKRSKLRRCETLLSLLDCSPTLQDQTIGKAEFRLCRIRLFGASMSVHVCACQGCVNFEGIS